MERPLSGVERMMYINPDGASANTFVCMRVRGALDDVRLRLSLDRLPRRHPMLSVRVVRSQDRLIFTTEGVPPIPLRFLADDGSGQSFLKLAAAEVTAPLDRTTGPLTRLTVVRHRDGQQADLLLATDHTVGDGFSCLYAIRDLLSSYVSPEIAVDPVPLPSQPTHLFPAPIADVAPPRSARSNARPQPTSMFSVSTSDIAIGGTQLTGENARALVRKCRERGVTVHAAVCAAFAASFAALAENRPRVIISSPVSYRHRLDPVARNTSICAVAFADIDVDLQPPQSFWEHAHAARRQLLEWTTDQKLFGLPSAIEEASRAEPDDARFLDRLYKHEKRHDFSISNLGSQPIPSRYGELTITAAHLGAALPGDICVVLCTMDDTMFVTWTANGLSTAANDVVRRIVASALPRLCALPP